MSIDEEIMKLDLIASDAFEGGDANEFRQLAEWLRELKAYRDTYKNYSKVEKMLICEVEKAKENPSVKKPISYGLYQTWKFWDKNEVVREVNADESVNSL